MGRLIGPGLMWLMLLQMTDHTTHPPRPTHLCHPTTTAACPYDSNHLPNYTDKIARSCCGWVGLVGLVGGRGGVSEGSKETKV